MLYISIAILATLLIIYFTTYADLAIPLYLISSFIAACIITFAAYFIAFPHTPATYQKQIDEVTIQQHELLSKDDSSLQAFKEYEKLSSIKHKLQYEKISRESVTSFLFFFKF